MLNGAVDIRASSSGESGFTLIELVVGMVLSLIVLGMLFAAVLDLFGSSERTGQRAKAQKAAVKASDTLTNDLRAARAPDRTPRKFGSPDNLRRYIQQQTAGTGMDLHDIVEADSMWLRFYADVDADYPGSECVTWMMDAVDRSIDRHVARLPCGTRANSPSTGAEISATEVIPPTAKNAAAAAKPGAPFRYRVLVPTATRYVCTTVSLPQSATLNGLRRDQVVAVDLDLRSFVSRAGARGDQRLVTSVSVASRQALEYRYALGCAA